MTYNLENGLWLIFQFVDDDKKIKFEYSQTHQKEKWARWSHIVPYIASMVRGSIR